MWSQITNVTDGQTDRQTTCDGKTALCTMHSASRGNKETKDRRKINGCYLLIIISSSSSSSSASSIYSFNSFIHSLIHHSIYLFIHHPHHHQFIDIAYISDFRISNTKKISTVSISKRWDWPICSIKHYIYSMVKDNRYAMLFTYFLSFCDFLRDFFSWIFAFFRQPRKESGTAFSVGAVFCRSVDCYRMFNIRKPFTQTHARCDRQMDLWRDACFIWTRVEYVIGREATPRGKTTVSEQHLYSLNKQHQCCQGPETTMRETYPVHSPSLLSVPFRRLPFPPAFPFLPSLLVRERSALATLIVASRVCLSVILSVCPQLRI